MVENRFNVTAQIRERASKHPDKKAFIWAGERTSDGNATYEHITYRDFEAQSDAYAFGLAEAGIGKGVKTIVLVHPDIRLFLILTALMKTGAVPIMIDSGMGVDNMMRCLATTGAEAFVGVPLEPQSLPSVKTHVSLGSKQFPGGYAISDIYRPNVEPFPINNPDPDELAIIFFTTGSTGPAKGVENTSAGWTSQIEEMKFIMDPEEEINLATFPIFAFFDIVLGNTAVLPDMDTSKPAEVNPVRIIEAIEDHKVTNIFGSPALLDRVGRYAQPRGLVFPSVKRVLSGGAPVSASIMSMFSALLVDAEVFSIYGATECLPISGVGSNEVLSEISRPEFLTQGTCVGRPFPGVEIRIIKISDEPIVEYTEDLPAEEGEVGEIMIKCAHMSTRYFNRPDADAVHKVRRDGEIWHRMGDLGRIDTQGRLWFCGRKKQRVITEKGVLFTVPCENIFNAHPQVKRSALVGIDLGKGVEPVICIEPEDNVKTDARLVEELLDTALASEMTESIRRVEFFTAFPVDIRHNAKIFREELAEECKNRIMNPC
jgi:acyl-coenzyme A synthetase/AMP-(fatty) acid ligase